MQRNQNDLPGKTEREPTSELDEIPKPYIILMSSALLETAFLGEIVPGKILWK
jgi:hypothetical protein